MIGMKFGHWTVAAANDRTATAVCRCGNVRVIAVEALVSGASTSCGCQPPSDAIRRDEAEQRRRRDLKWKSGIERETEGGEGARACAVLHRATVQMGPHHRAENVTGECVECHRLGMLEWTRKQPEGACAAKTKAWRQREHCIADQTRRSS